MVSVERMTTHEERQAIAARLRKARKVESSLVSITYHAAGTATGRKPGTEFKANITLPGGTHPFLVYLPAPHNGRQTALACLCRHLEGLTLGVAGATVRPS